MSSGEDKERFFERIEYVWNFENFFQPDSNEKHWWGWYEDALHIRISTAAPLDFWVVGTFKQWTVRWMCWDG